MLRPRGAVRPFWSSPCARCGVVEPHRMVALSGADNVPVIACPDCQMQWAPRLAHERPARPGRCVACGDDRSDVLTVDTGDMVTTLCVEDVVRLLRCRLRPGGYHRLAAAIAGNAEGEFLLRLALYDPDSGECLAGEADEDIWWLPAAT